MQSYDFFKLIKIFFFNVDILIIKNTAALCYKVKIKNVKLKNPNEIVSAIFCSLKLTEFYRPPRSMKNGKDCLK